MIAVEQRVHAVEAGHEAGRDANGVGHGVVAVEVVETGVESLEFGLVGDGLGAGGQSGEHLEGVIVELGDDLAAVGPDHPPSVGIAP